MGNGPFVLKRKQTLLTNYSLELYLGQSALLK